MWNSTGTVSVTNGSPVVTGAGTVFSFPNAQPGQAFVGPNGLPMEIASVDSASQITLARPYGGGTAAGQPFTILPTQSFANDLALAFAGFKNTFGGILDTVGQGMFPDGTVAAPGIRFAADQDTGFRRIGANGAAIVTGGVDRLAVDATGAVITGDAKVRDKLILQRGSGSLDLPVMSYWNGTGAPLTSGGKGDIVAVGNAGGDGLAFVNGDVERARIDTSGNLLVGVSSGSRHVISKVVPPNAGNAILDIENTGGQTIARFFSVSGGGLGAASPAALRMNKDASTGRTMNAEGTVNASGADYAEYIRKSLACGTILKGDVCGIDCNGELTRTWADARRFVVKSTDPNLVGGDTWAAHLGPKPEAPGAEPAAPLAPISPAPLPAMPAAPVREEGESDETFMPRAADFFAACLAYEVQVAELAAYQDAAAAYPGLLAAHQAAHVAWQAAQDAFQEDLQAWEAELEAARQTVDRIAFCGQVPVNVDADTLAACEAALGDGVAVYLVAVARGDGIGAAAVRETDMTLQLYMRRLGAVWAIRDGRPWVDVQHG